MSTLGKRLAEERLRQKLSQEDMKPITGMTKQTQSLYESDKRKADSDYFEKIHAAGFDVYYIITGQKVSTSSGIDEDEFIYVERFSIEASAGFGSTIDNEMPIGKAAFRRDWIHQKGLDPNRLCILKVKGDSMYPTLSDGDAVLVETCFKKTGDKFELGCDPKEIKRDGIYVLRIDGHLVVKRLQRDMVGGFIVKSDNPSYSDINISADNVNDFCVAGRVEWAGGDL